VLQQRLLLEKYEAKVKYIKGESNLVSDTLSRLTKIEEHEEELNYFWTNNNLKINKEKNKSTCFVNIIF